jgi:hypothetical protein
VDLPRTVRSLSDCLVPLVRHTPEGTRKDCSRSKLRGITSSKPHWRGRWQSHPRYACACPKPIQRHHCDGSCPRHDSLRRDECVRATPGRSQYHLGGGDQAWTGDPPNFEKQVRLIGGSPGQCPSHNVEEGLGTHRPKCRVSSIAKRVLMHQEAVQLSPVAHPAIEWMAFPGRLARCGKGGPLASRARSQARARPVRLLWQGASIPTADASSFWHHAHSRRVPIKPREAGYKAERMEAQPELIIAHH